MADVSKMFVEPMLARFELDVPDADVFLGDLRRELADFPEATLRDAVAWIVRRRKFRTFPSVAECSDACQAVLPETARAGLPVDTLTRAWLPWSKDVVARADAMICCDLGRQAADEGWIGRLWDLCRNRGRLPHAHEIIRLKAEARDFDLALSACQSGRGGAANAPLLALGKQMQARREQKAALARGER